MNDAIRNEIVRRLAAVRPSPKSELNFNSPFELLIAVMLSAQTTDQKVNAVTPALFAKAPTPQAMAALNPEDVEPFIKTLGLFRSKAKHVVEASRILCEKHNALVPQDFQALVSLPGVGEKTAKVVLNVAFGRPLMAVDTHIFRVCNRTGLCIGKTVKEVEDKLPALIDKEFIQDAHHYILLHGRYVCKAQKPQCGLCVIREYCKSYPLVKE